MRKMIHAAMIACLAAFGLTAASAQSAKPIEVIVFPGGFNWPIWVAQDKGYFEKNGVSVKVTPTPNSQFQLKNLIEGKFDIAMTAIDNVVAYSEGQGAAKTDVQPDIFAFMGGDNGFLRLVAVPDVKAISDLKGKQVSVDALTTGYAFVLRKLLENGGLKPGDFEFVSAGGVVQRYQALLKKEHAATLLISPFEVNAEAEGFNRLANADEALGRYQGLVGATRRSWAKENEKELIGYIRAYTAALDWLYDPANKAEAIAILRKNAPNLSETLAARSYDVLLHPSKGFTRGAVLDPEGVKTVLQLRSQYAEPKKELTDPGKYYDLSYYDKAKKN
ncbi:ABC transporter substrate-binding protein [Pseudorhodoplanes sinuspersici]|uniref:ABC transporter substrate-binding protein n=1 Tax=Pseudorhodoplanes sinuspersici TaxID=1235591 RepID=A0A1W6ZU77_9HYPH|nr:ABC transporter substrate-binding protein [Pseudorhodoplanes sinuspersici]ARQ00846.1 ABC transporter substrate-binding protein [Pseudorhodoplanes sinuspersici]RKE72465.1 ABC-type nitrate/sulfonate/bicarbonate transport system substrate-binding protein [Pseudorhodoplanes sinuspersici]